MNRLPLSQASTRPSLTDGHLSEPAPLRCQAPKPLQGFAWHDSLDRMKALAQRLDSRALKDLQQLDQMLDMGLSMASGWGAVPPQSLTRQVIDEVRNYMLGDLMTASDPFGLGSEVRSMDQARKTQFLERRVMKVFEDQHFRDLEEMDRVFREDGPKLRLELEWVEPLGSSRDALP